MCVCVCVICRCIYVYIHTLLTFQKINMYEAMRKNIGIQMRTTTRYGQYSCLSHGFSAQKVSS